MRRLANFVLFQTLWFWCVLATARGEHGWALGGAAVLIALEIALLDDPRRGLALAACAAPLGLLLESALIGLGAYGAAGLRAATFLAPLWLGALWAGFAATLAGSLAWLRGRYVVGALLGLVAGPIAYASGAGLDALELGPDHRLGLALIGVGWAAAMVGVLALDVRLSVRPSPAHAPS